MPRPPDRPPPDPGNETAARLGTRAAVDRKGTLNLQHQVNPKTSGVQDRRREVSRETELRRKLRGLKRLVDLQAREVELLEGGLDRWRGLARRLSVRLIAANKAADWWWGCFDQLETEFRAEVDSTFDPWGLRQ